MFPKHDTGEKNVRIVREIKASRKSVVIWTVPKNQNNGGSGCGWTQLGIYVFSFLSSDTLKNYLMKNGVHFKNLG